MKGHEINPTPHSNISDISGNYGYGGVSSHGLSRLSSPGILSSGNLFMGYSSQGHSSHRYYSHGAFTPQGVHP